MWGSVLWKVAQAWQLSSTVQFSSEWGRSQCLRGLISVLFDLNEDNIYSGK